LYHPIRFLVVSKLGESESTRIASKLIANNLNGIGMKTGPREPILKLCFAGLVGKVAYKQFFQGDSYWPYSLAGLGLWAHANPAGKFTRLPCTQVWNENSAGVNLFDRWPGYWICVINLEPIS
jgi:hypothetical protein